MRSLIYKLQLCALQQGTQCVTTGYLEQLLVILLARFFSQNDFEALALLTFSEVGGVCGWSCGSTHPPQNMVGCDSRGKIQVDSSVKNGRSGERRSLPWWNAILLRTDAMLHILYICTQGCQGFVPTCFQVTEKAFAGKAFSQANFKGKAQRRFFFLFSRFPPPIVRASRDRSPWSNAQRPPFRVSLWSWQ